MPSAGPDEALPTGAKLTDLIGPAPVLLFARKLQQLGVTDGRLGIAVSGGSDSAALLLLAAAAAVPGAVAAATVDHGLRPEAAAEAAGVARLCGRLGIAHTTLRVSVSDGDGPQAAARDARYAALADWCPGRFLLTAHQRDDAAESLLMRLARGSGVRGLARMPEVSVLRLGGPMLARPLLDWSRESLADVCHRAGIDTIQDPSNSDPRYDRTRARALLADTPWLDPFRLARSAANLADADEALEWLADRCWQERVTERDDAVEIDAAGLPHDTTRRLVERTVRMFAGSDRPRDVEGMVQLLKAGRPSTLAGVMATPGAVWRFRRAPPRRSS